MLTAHTRRGEGWRGRFRWASIDFLAANREPLDQPLLSSPFLFSSRSTFYQELVKTRATLRRAINLS